MTPTEFMKRYDNKETFTEYELHDLFWGDYDKDVNVLVEEEDSFCDEPDRWNYTKTIIYRFVENDTIRYFAFYGWLGNTELQENYFDIQPEEVKPIKITTTDWETIK